MLVRFDFNRSGRPRSAGHLASASVELEDGDRLVSGVVIHGFDLWSRADGAPAIEITTRKACGRADDSCFGIPMDELRRTILVGLIKQHPEVIARVAGFDVDESVGCLQEVA